MQIKLDNLQAEIEERDRKKLEELHGCLGRAAAARPGSEKLMREFGSSCRILSCGVGARLAMNMISPRDSE